MKKILSAFLLLCCTLMLHAAKANKKVTITVGIHATLNDNREAISNNRYYNLQGCQVTNPQHGLYIKNGKKILVR